MIENIKDFFDWMGYEHPAFSFFLSVFFALIILLLVCSALLFFPLYSAIFIASVFLIKFILIVREYRNE